MWGKQLWFDLDSRCGVRDHCKANSVHCRLLHQLQHHQQQQDINCVCAPASAPLTSSTITAVFILSQSVLFKATRCFKSCTETCDLEHGLTDIRHLLDGYQPTRASSCDHTRLIFIWLLPTPLHRLIYHSINILLKCLRGEQPWFIPKTCVIALNNSHFSPLMFLLYSLRNNERWKTRLQSSCTTKYLTFERVYTDVLF